MAPKKKAATTAAKALLKLKSLPDDSVPSGTESVVVSREPSFPPAPKKTFFPSDSKPFEVGRRILCQHTDSFFYDAKILQVFEVEGGGFGYKIHYNGWNSRYDEELTHEQALEEFLPYTAENVAVCKEEISDARKRKKPRPITKRVSNNIGIDADKSVIAKPKKQKEDVDTKAPETQKPTGRDMGLRDSDAAETEVHTKPKPYLAQVPKERITSYLMFPEHLDRILIEDADKVNRHFKVPKLPARITIDTIINEFIMASKDPLSNVQPSTNESYESLHTIVNFFNKLVNVHILYPLEFVQHLELLNERKRAANLPEVLLADITKESGPLEGEVWVQLSGPSDVTVADENNRVSESVSDSTTDSAVSNAMDDSATSENTDSRKSTRKVKKKVIADFGPNTVSVKKPPAAKSLPKEVRSPNVPLPMGPVSEVGEAGPILNFADSYGVLHFVRFLYYFNSLIKDKKVPAPVSTKHMQLVNEIIEFVSLRVNGWFDAEMDYEDTSDDYKRLAFSA